MKNRKKGDNSITNNTTINRKPKSNIDDGNDADNDRRVN